mmetsp:Transcript_11563/g.29321  ORF Transcript_11563/g.29321 Transcript_11563/m.29321 type:complete len:224 (+) Transcript_11563:1270-1941(+)
MPLRRARQPPRHAAGEWALGRLPATAGRTARPATDEGHGDHPEETGPKTGHCWRYGHQADMGFQRQTEAIRSLRVARRASAPNKQPSRTTGGRTPRGTGARLAISNLRVSQAPAGPGDRRQAARRRSEIARAQTPRPSTRRSAPSSKTQSDAPPRCASHESETRSWLPSPAPLRPASKAQATAALSTAGPGPCRRPSPRTACPARPARPQAASVARASAGPAA